MRFPAPFRRHPRYLFVVDDVGLASGVAVFETEVEAALYVKHLQRRCAEWPPCVQPQITPVELGGWPK